MTGKMKAQVFYEPEVMKMEQRDIPQIADNEVLVKVKSVGICGSDVSYYYGHSPLDTPNGKGPLVLGHEFSGEVVQVGGIPKSLGLFEIGDRVTCNPVQQCNSCEKCSEGQFNLCDNPVVAGVNVDGALAEYCKLSYTHVYKIPDTMTYDHAAVLEPLACATYGVKKLDVTPGDFVVVFGPGPIGIMMTQLIKASGAGKIAMVGIFDYPLGVALESGADYAINVADKNSKWYTDDVTAKIKELSGGKMASRVIVPTAAKQALQDALTVSGPASTIVYFGLPGPEDTIEVPALDTITSDKTIKFSWLAPLVWPTAIRAVGNGLLDLDKLITHKFSLEDAEVGIKFMKESTEDKLKGVVVVDAE